MESTQDLDPPPRGEILPISLPLTILPDGQISPVGHQKVSFTLPLNGFFMRATKSLAILIAADNPVK
jgi:hypothetical protein